MTQDELHGDAWTRVLPDDERDMAKLVVSLVASTGHELRGPLNVILGMTGLLGDARLTPDEAELVADIRRSAELLVAGVNEMSDIVNGTADGVPRQSIEFSLRTLMEDLGDLVAPKAEARGLELAIAVDREVPEWIAGDPGGMRRMLSMLVNTAIRMAHRGEIEVQAGPTPNHVGRLRLSVTYDGPAVFDGRVSPAGGTRVDTVDANLMRLGLASLTARQLGGSLWVEQPGDGRSGFVFESDFEVIATKDRVLQERQVRLEGVKILVADDSDANRRLLVQILRGWGCETVAASGGSEALDRLHESEGSRPFDLAILDFVMPGMDGAAVAKVIRAHPSAASMPLILLTSSPAPGDGERMRQVGFDAYLTKPVERLELMRAIRSVLARPAEERGALITRHTLRESLRSKLRILLVEDDATNQETIAQMLKQLGYGCDVASNGETAVRALARREYDVVLMDCQMPVMDGLEATRRIREREQGTRRRTPIIATTADALAGSPETLRQAGMDEYVPKPIDIRKLAEILARLNGDEVPPPQPAGGEAGQAQPIDVSRLELMTGDDPVFLRKIVAMFLDEGRGRLTALEEGLKKDDFDAIRSEAHALKGAAANLGAGEVSTTAAALQRAAEERDHSRCQRLLSRLETNVNAAGRWLETYVGHRDTQ